MLVGESVKFTYCFQRNGGLLLSHNKSFYYIVRNTICTCSRHLCMHVCECANDSKNGPRLGLPVQTRVKRSMFYVQQRNDIMLAVISITLPMTMTCPRWAGGGLFVLDPNDNGRKCHRGEQGMVLYAIVKIFNVLHFGALQVYLMNQGCLLHAAVIDLVLLHQNYVFRVYVKS